MISKVGGSPWFSVLKSNPGASLRLFCFPYAGGGGLAYRPWVDALPASVEVCVINLPGRGSRPREASYTRIEPLVENLSDAFLTVLDRPYAFFGHSMGALVSFECARRLRGATKWSLEHLFVSGSAAPQLPITREPVHTLPTPELIERLRTLEGTPREILEHEELMEMMLPILRADFSICDTYKYEPGLPLDCPLSALGGLGDLDIPREKLEAWETQTTNSFKVRMFQGGHFFLHSARPLLLRILSEELWKLSHERSRA